MDGLPRYEVTRLLAAAQKGDDSAHERLWSLIYGELHRMARLQLANEPRGKRLHPTSLIHEVYLRLAGDQMAEWHHRGHFFSAAAQAMRRIRVDYARSRGSLKRGGNRQLGPLLDDPPTFDQDAAEVLAIDEALTRLGQEYPQKAEVVSMRYFAGLTVDETATALGLGPRTVDKYWAFARAWLHRELTKGGAERE
ncbi:MAG: sigma-70 family RNA polymerase sigma factor [Planctomycetes bacterium]|nr:sigma-70 family RNA polymerase sigma factor [Planctomycetota bacterium]